MRIHEFGQSRDIHIDTDFGTARGTVHSQRERFEEWFIRHEANDEARGLFAMFPDSKLIPIATLIRINSQDKYRDDLMRMFLNAVSEAKNVVIIAHGGTEWYQMWGFTEIGQARDKKMMMLNNY